jgi:hypothetical protein
MFNDEGGIAISAASPPARACTRGSALLGWVKDDAAYIARHISAA